MQNRILIILASILLSGCASSNLQEPTYQEAARENARRLAGEDFQGERTVTFQVEQAVVRLWQSVRELYLLATGRTPLAAAADMENKDSADARRAGIYDLADRTYVRKQKEPYTTRWAQIAFGLRDGERMVAPPDPDFSVRAAAIRSLNRVRAHSVKDLKSKGETDLIPFYIEALGDKSDAVRLEAAKALANMPDPRALQSLIKCLADANCQQDIRIAAADALRNFRNLESAQALAKVLLDPDFGVAWQARASLILMTGKSLGYEPAVWLQYLATEAKPST